ncbi:MAG: hypothetical protein ACRCST_03420 [Turicibacter sp.]
MKKINLLIGVFIYISIFFLVWLSPALNAMAIQVFSLAFELSLMMSVFYVYPLFILVVGVKFKNTSLINSQTKLSASAVVSLGLIGTFIGLTGMISSISGALSGGDTEALMQAISEALSSMSYAFLTSIVGVTLSLLLLVSSNFWCKSIDVSINNKKHNAVWEYQFYNAMNRLTESLDKSISAINNLSDSVNVNEEKKLTVAALEHIMLSQQNIQIKIEEIIDSQLHTNERINSNHFKINEIRCQLSTVQDACLIAKNVEVMINDIKTKEEIKNEKIKAAIHSFYI